MSGGGGTAKPADFESLPGPKPLEPTAKGRLADPGSAVPWGLGFAFFVACSWASYAHWANFDYRTFDLAYYVQGLWQLIHGRFEGSILGVPLLGNHVEPIIFLMAQIGRASCRERV